VGEGGLVPLVTWLEPTDIAKRGSGLQTGMGESVLLSELKGSPE
jgi:hypothetical protein